LTDTLSLSEVQSGDAGTYSVSVSNVAGSTNSAPATLTVFVVPEFTSTVLQVSNLVSSGAGGLEGDTYYVLASMDMPTRMTNWVRVATNVFGDGGTFSVTNAVSPAQRRQFFRLQIP
jgi:hypothetical protein